MFAVCSVVAGAMLVQNMKRKRQTRYRGGGTNHYHALRHLRHQRLEIIRDLLEREETFTMDDQRMHIMYLHPLNAEESRENHHEQVDVPHLRTVRNAWKTKPGVTIEATGIRSGQTMTLHITRMDDSNTGNVGNHGGFGTLDGTERTELRNSPGWWLRENESRRPYLTKFFSDERGDLNKYDYTFLIQSRSIARMVDGKFLDETPKVELNIPGYVYSILNQMGWVGAGLMDKKDQYTATIAYYSRQRRGAKKSFLRFGGKRSSPGDKPRIFVGVQLTSEIAERSIGFAGDSGDVFLSFCPFNVKGCLRRPVVGRLLILHSRQTHVREGAYEHALRNLPDDLKEMDTLPITVNGTLPDVHTTYDELGELGFTCVDNLFATSEVTDVFWSFVSTVIGIEDPLVVDGRPKNTLKMTTLWRKNLFAKSVRRAICTKWCTATGILPEGSDELEGITGTLLREHVANDQGVVDWFLYTLNFSPGMEWNVKKESTKTSSTASFLTDDCLKEKTNGIRIEVSDGMSDKVAFLGYAFKRQNGNIYVSLGEPTTLPDVVPKRLFVSIKLLHKGDFNMDGDIMNTVFHDSYTLKLEKPKTTLFHKVPVQRLFRDKTEVTDADIREVEWVTKIAFALLYCDHSTNDVINYLTAVMLPNTPQNTRRGQNVPQDLKDKMKEIATIDQWWQTYQQNAMTHVFSDMEWDDNVVEKLNNALNPNHTMVYVYRYHPSGFRQWLREIEDEQFSRDKRMKAIEFIMNSERSVLPIELLDQKFLLEMLTE